MPVVVILELLSVKLSKQFMVPEFGAAHSVGAPDSLASLPPILNGAVFEAW